MSKWVIEEVGDDHFDILRDGRRLKCDYSWSAAVAFVRRQRKPTDTVYREDPDGYRAKLSRLT